MPHYRPTEALPVWFGHSVPREYFSIDRFLQKTASSTPKVVHKKGLIYFCKWQPLLINSHIFELAKPFPCLGFSQRLTWTPDRIDRPHWRREINKELHVELSARFQRKQTQRKMQKCPTCQKTVYFAERVRSIGQDWHKLCLKCVNCNKLLGQYLLRNLIINKNI